MKKMIILVCLLSLFLVGCHPKTTTILDIDTAKRLALKHYPNCEIVSTVSNLQTEMPNYIISLSVLKDIYVITIDAITGSMVENAHQPLDYPITNLAIGIIEAKQLALNYHNGELTDFYLNETDKIPTYTAFINDGSYLFKLSVNAMTGEVSEIDHHIIQNKKDSSAYY